MRAVTSSSLPFCATRACKCGSYRIGIKRVTLEATGSGPCSLQRSRIPSRCRGGERKTHPAASRGCPDTNRDRGVSPLQYVTEMSHSLSQQPHPGADQGDHQVRESFEPDVLIRLRAHASPALDTRHEGAVVTARVSAEEVMALSHPLVTTSATPSAWMDACMHM